MTSCVAVLVWLAAVLPSTVSLDSTVCKPATPTVPLPVPAAALGEVWEAEVEWKDDVKNRTYVIHDYADMTINKEKLVISIPLLDDVILLYDWNTRDVIVEEEVLINREETSLQCRVVQHSNTGGTYAYNNLFWFTSIQVLMNQFAGSSDAIAVGKSTVRGIQTTKWTACLYDYYTNMTVRANLYFSERTWLLPYLTPNSEVPVRMEYVGRIHNGSEVTDINLVGDVIAFRKHEAANKFAPDVFTTKSGAFCANRTGTFMPMPQFQSQLSVMMEVIDVDFSRVSYEELFYDSQLRMVRLDSKLALGKDSDPTSYIFDFQSGIKYIIDKYLMSCTASPLVYGDDFVAPWTNGSLGMSSTADYFNAENVQDTQYVGKATVRNALCDSWIGHYFDRDANRMTTVQWYFLDSRWMEAAGTTEGVSSFFMMKVWKGGSGNPKIYNVMRFSPTAPDFDVFDFSVCFTHRAKKHFTIEFRVDNMDALRLVSSAYLKPTVVKDLAKRLRIQMNRFTDVTFDSDVTTKSLFMSSTLLDRAILTQYNKHEIALEGAFDFLKGSIDAAHIAFNLTVPGFSYVTLTGVDLVEHNFRREFTTSTIPTQHSTKIVAPTRAPPKRGSSASSLAPPTPSIPTTCPPPPPCSCSPGTVSLCPSPSPCPSQKPCPSTSSSSSSSNQSFSNTTCRCPAQRCPTPKPCTTQNVSTVKRCSCHGATSSVSPSSSTSSSRNHAHSTSAPPCYSRLHESSSNSGIFAGAMAGGMVAALILGLVIGIIATRFYHITRSNDQMTINLIEDNI